MRLASFSVANYRSFNNEQTIRFNSDNFNADAVIGPNGSGKSNFFAALLFFRNFVQSSTQFAGQQMHYEPFLLKIGNENRPTLFKAEIQGDKKVFMYRFALLNGKVVEEKLQYKNVGGGMTFKTIFSRKSIINGSYENDGFTNELLKTTRDDALVLTRAFESNNKVATELFECLNHLKLITGAQPIGETAQKIIESEEYRNKVVDLLQKSDLYIHDVAAQEMRMPDEVLNGLPIKDEFKKNIDRTGYQITTTHLLRDECNKVVGTRNFLMSLHESTGAKRIFELSFPLIDTLENGNVLFIDEFETAMHPKECAFIVSLFKNNPNGAQLIINTHWTGVIDQIGRKNIHLFGKNNSEETIIGEISSDARETALEKKYNRGIFGAVPNIREL
jgi:AAA15 family ATPase/GTPase